MKILLQKILVLGTVLFTSILFSLDTHAQPFIEDIRRFEALDRESPPPQNAILFMGSSSFTMWQDVNDYFPGYTIINRGFGASTLEDQIRYVQRIVTPYQPLQIVIYCGENDFAYDDTLSVSTVSARFIQLFELIRGIRPNAPIAYISMKPSPLRWNLADKYKAANEAICHYLELQPNASYIDVWDAMLGSNQQPDSSIFHPDMLHINDKGYTIWQSLIKEHLVR